MVTSPLERLVEVHALCPEMRIGQLLATVGLMGEDKTGRSLWDLEDGELADALDHFAADLAQRGSDASLTK